MGQTLSEPVTHKHTESDGDARLKYGASSMQGWRVTMEDAHTTLLSHTPKTALFAVFDGHGGPNVAMYSGSKLAPRLSKDPEFEKGDYARALKNAFLGLDIDLRADPAFADETSGCTAVAAVITKDWKIIAANAGDSRIVLSANGTAIPLSYDHKPTNESENARIVAAGGFVEYSRVNGNLALSRAIGDFEFKKNSDLPAEEQVVTADPDILERTLLPDDEFVILACDGIWDCMSNQEVIDFCRVKIAESRGDLGLVAEMIMTYCLAADSDLGSVGCDNMTVVIVAIMREGQSYETWVEQVTDRVAKAGLKVDESMSVAGRAGPSHPSILSYARKVTTTTVAGEDGEEVVVSEEEEEIAGNY